jgi:hypothetical protein
MYYDEGVLANTCLLAALIAIIPDQVPPSRRRLVMGGILLGAGVAIKLRGLLPVLILVGWALLRFGARSAGLLLANAAACVTAICLPFFVAAPRRMWEMIVRDQLLRVPTDTTLIERITDILGLGHLPLRVTLLLIMACAAVLVGVVLAWQQVPVRPAVLCSSSSARRCCSRRPGSPLLRADRAGDRHHCRRGSSTAPAPHCPMAITADRCIRDSARHPGSRCCSAGAR